MKEFYSNYLITLKLKRYKLLHRWERFSTKIDVIDKTEPMLRSRVSTLDQEIVTIQKRSETLGEQSEDAVCFLFSN
jgi:chaperonin cofactor prefoldin